MAIEARNLSIVKWLKEQGCSWDTSVFITAIKTGKREIIPWLHEEKCPMDEAVIDDLMKKYVYYRYNSDEKDSTDDDNDENESFSSSGHFWGSFDENDSFMGMI